MVLCECDDYVLARLRALVAVPLLPSIPSGKYESIFFILSVMMLSLLLLKCLDVLLLLLVHFLSYVISFSHSYIHAVPSPVGDATVPLATALASSSNTLATRAATLTCYEVCLAIVASYAALSASFCLFDALLGAASVTVGCLFYSLAVFFSS